MTQKVNQRETFLVSHGIPYPEKLNSWIIVRLLPNMQRVSVGRFRKRSDADGHLQCLKHLIPQANFILVFDPKS